MRENDLDGLSVFLAVAECRGFSAAAVRLGISPSAVSQAVRQLEKRVGTPLFNRTTRSIGLTQEGASFLERVAPALEQIAAATEELGDRHAGPSGLLRLNVPRAAYFSALQPVLAAYMRSYPAVTVEVSVDASLVDIVAGGFDAGMRFGGMVDGDMVGVAVGPVLRTVLLASPAYLAEHGVPTHPDQLVSHRCIGYRFQSSGQLERWDFCKGEERVRVHVAPQLIFDDNVAVTHAAAQGLGIGNLISGYADEWLQQGRLVPVLDDWCPDLPPLTLYYPSRKRVPQRLRALIDMLQAAR